MAFMDATTDDVAAKAGAIQEKLATTVSEVRANTNLSKDGQIRGIAAAYVTALDEMANLKEANQTTSTKSHFDTTVEVFGSVTADGMDAISARDADDRAAQLSDAREGLDVLQRAESNGDQVLARAIALRAFVERGSLLGRSWDTVLGAYVERRPDVASKLAELEQVRQNDTEISVGQAFIFWVPQPSELQSRSEYQARMLAEQKEPTPSRDPFTAWR